MIKGSEDVLATVLAVVWMRKHAEEKAQDVVPWTMADMVEDQLKLDQLKGSVDDDAHQLPDESMPGRASEASSSRSH